MRLHALALFVLLSACSSGQTLPGCLISERPPDEVDAGFAGTGGGSEGGGSSFVGDPATLIILVGQPSTIAVSVAAPLISFCDGAMPMAPTGATLSVSGPDNLPVMSTQTGPSLMEAEYVDSLTFTPQQPGDYHLVATFEPDLGVAQLDVPAAFDRSTLPVQSTYDGAGIAECEQLGVTALGTLLCVNGDAVVAYRNGGQVDMQTGTLMAIHGSSIWIATVNMPNVSHFIDTGTGVLQPGNPPAVETPSAVTALVPGDDDVLVVMTDRTALFTTSDGGVSLTQQWLAAPGLTAAVRNGTSIIARGDGSLFANTDGGAELDPIVGTENLVCVAYGPEGLWMVDLTTGVLEIFTPGNHSPTATLFGLTGWNPPNGLLMYGTAPVAVANMSQTFSATWDSTLNAPVMSMWGQETSMYFVNGSWSAARDSNTGHVVVTHLSTP